MLLLIASIILPQLLAGLQIAIVCPGLLFDLQAKTMTLKQSVKYGFFTFCLSPLLSLLLHLKLQMFHLMEKLKLDNEDMYNKKSLIKYHLRNTIKLELGLETIYQLSIQLLLLFNATSGQIFL